MVSSNSGLSSFFFVFGLDTVIPALDIADDLLVFIFQAPVVPWFVLIPVFQYSIYWLTGGFPLAYLAIEQFFSLKQQKNSLWFKFKIYKSLLIQI